MSALRALIESQRDTKDIPWFRLAGAGGALALAMTAPTIFTITMNTARQ